MVGRKIWYTVGRAGGRRAARFLGRLASILGHLGSTLAHLGSILGHIGSILAHLGSILAHLGSILDHLGSILTPQPPPKAFAKKYEKRYKRAQAKTIDVVDFMTKTRLHSGWGHFGLGCSSSKTRK